MSAARDRGRPMPVRELTELSPEVLRGVIESFVRREGTDCGEREAYIQIDPPDSCETIVTSR